MGICTRCFDIGWDIGVEFVSYGGVGMMGILSKLVNPGNYRTMVDIAKISSKLERHLNKRCAYCGLDLGQDTPVVEFVQHLAQEHPDRLEPNEAEQYQKIIKKVTG